jgi:hypothetical protein
MICSFRDELMFHASSEAMMLCLEIELRRDCTESSWDKKLIWLDEGLGGKASS